jgi:putative RNA 2'-phosphotransferase
MNKKDASKKLCWLLRHAQPLSKEIDSEGFVSIAKLIEISEITLEQIDSIVEEDKKNRYEIRGDQIRARYGHNKDFDIVKVSANPPPTIFHGTSNENLGNILNFGLIPGERRHVHLTTLRQSALEAGKRKSKIPIILTIDSEKAFENGISFYEEEDFVWLADYIASKYIIGISTF